MKLSIRSARFPFAALLCAAGIVTSGVSAHAQAAKSGKSKATAKPSAKGTAAKKPSTEAELGKHVAANIKFLNVLSRYADALNAAKDPATASLAAAQIEVITKDAILAGEELARLGRPTAELEAKISTDKELAATAARVAETTQTAVTALAANDSVKELLNPAIENFQSALNRIQQFAEDPAGKPGGAPAGAPEATAAVKPDEKTPPKK
jgi:hypothetical protein